LEHDRLNYIHTIPFVVVVALWPAFSLLALGLGLCAFVDGMAKNVHVSPLYLRFFAFAA
jgi:hypothetical protein